MRSKVQILILAQRRIQRGGTSSGKIYGFEIFRFGYKRQDLLSFQARVWQALCAIPAGRTASYAEIAARIGAPRSMRAVALACAANPVAVAIPCHRVVRHDGGLSGYRWGVERKRALLARESQRES